MDPEGPRGTRGTRGPASHHRALRVLVGDERGRAVPAASALARWLRHIAPARARGLVSVALVTDTRARALNRRYRGVDCATDVLSFPLDAGWTVRVHQPSAGPNRLRPARAVRRSTTKAEGPRCLGDIVIARGVARRQARGAGHSEAIEWRVLALHGLLHLLGYDHTRDGGRMRRIERQLRRRGGLPDGLIDRAERP